MGSSFAWVLAIVLIPYVGIPLYLVFGGRKFARVAGSESRLSVPDAPGDDLQRRLRSAAPLRERHATRETARLASWFEATMACAVERTPRSSGVRSEVEDVARLLSPLV